MILMLFFTHGAVTLVSNSHSTLQTQAVAPLAASSTLGLRGFWKPSSAPKYKAVELRGLGSFQGSRKFNIIHFESWTWQKLRGSWDQVYLGPGPDTQAESLSEYITRSRQTPCGPEQEGSWTWRSKWWLSSPGRITLSW